MKAQDRKSLSLGLISKNTRSSKYFASGTLYPYFFTANFNNPRSINNFFASVICQGKPRSSSMAVITRQIWGAISRKVNPAIEVFPVSAKTGEGIEAFYNWVLERRAADGAAS